MKTLKSKLLPPKLDLENLEIKSPGCPGDYDFNMGLRTAQVHIDTWYAQHVAPLFANAVEVTGYFNSDEPVFGGMPDKADTHRALLIGVEPIERGVSVEEIVRVLRKSMSRDEFVELADRIEREGVRK